MRGTAAARGQGASDADVVAVVEVVAAAGRESAKGATADTTTRVSEMRDPTRPAAAAAFPALRPTVFRATRAALGVASVAVAAVTLAPVVLPAQSQLSIAGHGARDFALPGAPYLYGASLATYTSAVGVRIGGALGDVREVHPSSSSSTTPSTSESDTRLELGAWAADVDVIIAPAQIRAVRAALGGLGPYAFVGLGTQGVRRAAFAPRESGPAWSYGGGLAQPLLGALWFETEARYRMPIVSDGVVPPSGFTRAWEYRLGLALRFGGRERRGDDGGGGEPARGARRGGRRGDGGWERARDPR